MFQPKSSIQQARWGCSKKAITKKMSRKWMSKYAKRHGIAKVSCPFMEAIAKLEKVPEIKELRTKPKNYSIEEAKDIINAAVLRGIRLSYMMVDDKAIFSIFSTSQDKAVLHEEAKALKVLIKKEKEYLIKLVDICNKVDSKTK